jgi:hypothetical protein
MRPAHAAPGHNTSRRLALALALFAAALLAGGAHREAAAEPAEYLPVRSALYDEIEALAARRVLDSLTVYTRPLARIDIARALDRARRLHPGLERDLHYRRLERELVRELADLGAPCDARETGPLIDTGPGNQRLRVALAAHARGDYDEKRSVAHFQMRDESSLSARGAIQIGSAFGAFEDLGVTRIRGQRAFIDPLASRTDLELAVLRGEMTARSGPLGAGAGYESFRWGPGRHGTLLLSEAAGPMTFLSFQGAFGGRFTATALSAVLSRADGRHLAAHRIEWAASPILTLGFAEAARYQSGTIDPLYAAGVFPYALVRRIHIRDASTDSLRIMERANVMASADVTVRPLPALTLYGELLVDDFATKSSASPDQLGFQAGFRSERPYGEMGARFLGEYTRVFNYTYSVSYDRNFIYRDRPLGYHLGPDVENVWLEAALDLSRDWQVRWTGDFTNHGEGRLGIPWVPGQDGSSSGHLSGVIERTREVWGDARWLPRDDVDLSAGLGFRRIENEQNVEGAKRTAWLARLALDVRY